MQWSVSYIMCASVTVGDSPVDYSEVLVCLQHLNDWELLVPLLTLFNIMDDISNCGERKRESEKGGQRVKDREMVGRRGVYYNRII